MADRGDSGRGGGFEAAQGCGHDAANGTARSTSSSSGRSGRGLAPRKTPRASDGAAAPEAARATRSTALVLLIAMASIAGLTACTAPGSDAGGESQTDPDVPERTGDADVLLWHSYRGGEAEALEDVVDAYLDAHPGLRIRVLAVPNEAYTNKLASAIPRGNGPDLFIGSHDQTGAWAEMKLLAPIDESDLATDGDATDENGPDDGREPSQSLLDGFYPLTVDALRFDGELYGLPLTFKSPVLIYNKDLVETPPRSTDALFGLLQRWRSAESDQAGEADERFGLAYPITSAYYHSAWMHGFGGHIFDPASGEVDLANEGTARSLELARRLSDYLPHQADGARIKQLFNDGQVAMVIDGPWFLPQIDDDIDYGLATLPFIDEADAWAQPFVTSEGVFVSAEARDPGQALDLARFLATDGARIRAVDGKQMVAWRAANAEAADLLPEAEAARRQVFVDQLEHAVVMSNDPAMSSVWSPLEQALQKAVYGAPSGMTPYWLLLAITLLAAGVWLVMRGRDASRRGGAKPVLVVLGGVCLAAVVPVVWQIVSLYGSGQDLPPTAVLEEAQRRYEMVQAPPAAAANPTPFIAVAGLVLIGLIGIALWRYRRQRRSGMEYPDNKVALAYISPTIIAMIVLVVGPFLVGTGLSFFVYERGEFTFVGLQNFERLIAGEGAPPTDSLSFYFTLVVTVLWTGLNVFLHVAIGLGLALLLRDPWLRLRGVYRVLLIIPWAVPNYITALIWRGMFDSQFGAINGILTSIGLAPVNWFDEFITSFAANLITNTWLGFPFMMVVTLGALQAIPRDLEDAAAVDGANRWQRFRHVTLPLLKPALLPAVILGSVWTFNMFNIIYLVSGGAPDSSTEILISEAYKWAFERQFQYGYAAAYATFVFLILVVYSRMTRSLLEGEPT